MTKKTRYILIAICVATFAVAAPLITLYIRGITYDQNDKRYLKTGILSIESEPKSAEIILDGKSVDSTPSDIRFLRPGGYDIKIQKNGYFPWSKRLEVIANKVTWVNPEGGKIFLFLSNPEKKEIANDVISFTKLPNGWLYLTKQSLVKTSDEEGKNITTINLPRPANLILNSADNSTFLLTSEKNIQIYKLADNSIKDISTIIKNAKNLNFDDQNNLWFLENNNLFQLNTQNFVKTLVEKNVSAFTIRDNQLYFSQKNITTKNFDLKIGAVNTQDPNATALKTNVPQGKNNSLVVTVQKEIFLITDGALYRVNENIEKLASGIKEFNYNSLDQTFVFATESELSFYNAAENKIQLINRSANGFENFQLKSSVGHAFYLQNKKVLAVELDLRDKQNSYVIADNLLGDTKFTLDTNAKKMYLLSAGKLEILNIR